MAYLLPRQTYSMPDGKVQFYLDKRIQCPRQTYSMLRYTSLIPMDTEDVKAV